MNKKLYISIPDSCGQQLDDAVPGAQGQYCAHCSKTVIDFTNWTDDALYAYLRSHHNICGTLWSSQMDRPIEQQQRSSTVYRAVASIGFTLLMAAMPGADLYARPPYAQVAAVSVAEEQPVTTDSIRITGNVYRKRNSLPLGDVQVWYIVNGVERPLAVTTGDGNYTATLAAPGSYTIRFTLAGYITDQRTVSAEAGQSIQVDGELAEAIITTDDLVKTVPPLYQRRGGITIVDDQGRKSGNVYIVDGVQDQQPAKQQPKKKRWFKKTR